VSRLKASSIQINYSDLPSEKKKINEMIKSKQRQTTDSKSCYYEIFIKDIELDRHITQSNLIVYFSLKNFANQNSLILKNDIMQIPTSAFPAKDPAKKEEASNRVRESLKIAVGKFVQKRFN
jgi:hypothetical protein